MTPKKSTKTNTSKKAMLQALEKSLGVVTDACRQVGIDRSTHYGWLKSDPEYKAAVESIEDIAIDFSESQLLELIRSGDTTATIFHLKTKGRKRGYNDRDQMHIKATNDTIQLQIDIDRGEG